MKSPKGLGWLASFSLGSQDILHRPCQLGPNPEKRPKEIEKVIFWNGKRLFVMNFSKNRLPTCMKKPDTF